MKQFAFLMAFGVLALTVASFVTPNTTPSKSAFLPGLDAGPRYPLTVVKVKGKVKYGLNKLKEGDRITDLTRLKFDSTTNIVKVKDTQGWGYFVLPRDYELSPKKACNSTICKAKVVEKASLPGGF